MAVDGRITFGEAINLNIQFAVQNVKLCYLLIYLKGIGFETSHFFLHPVCYLKRSNLSLLCFL